MKLSKTAWLILGIGIFVVATGSLYAVYLQQGREQEQLNDSLSAARTTLPQLISDRDDLQSHLTRLKSELAQAESSFDAAKAGFPESVESIEYDDELFDIADSCNLVDIADSCNLGITRLTASEPSDKKASDKKEEELTYFVTSFTVEVEGKVGDILDFVHKIATGGYFTNAAIELVNMQITGPEEAEEEQEEEEEKSSATIELIIYGYRGE